MSQEPDLPSDSDEDDEDYVPDGISEGETEDEVETVDEENTENKQQIKRKRGENGKQSKRRKTKVNVSSDDTNKDPVEKQILSEEEEKKRADSLWADFMKDTNTDYKTKEPKSPPKTQEKNEVTVKLPDKEKIKVIKIFEFAGEEVKVEKEVAVNSAEARLTVSGNESSTNSNSSRKSVRSGGLSGISSVLGQIGKKSKISTLEKSKLDWDNFKKRENLEEEIHTYNKGKSGYLERQDFLERADFRQFEIEKQLRTTTRRSNR